MIFSFEQDEPEDLHPWLEGRENVLGHQYLVVTLTLLQLLIDLIQDATGFILNSRIFFKVFCNDYCFPYIILSAISG